MVTGHMGKKISFSVTLLKRKKEIESDFVIVFDFFHFIIRINKCRIKYLKEIAGKI